MYRGIRSRLMPLALDAIWEQSTERHAANQTGRVLAGLTSDLPAHHSPPLPSRTQPSLCHLSCPLQPFQPTLPPRRLRPTGYRTNLAAGTSPFSSLECANTLDDSSRRSLRTTRPTYSQLHRPPPGAPLRAATVNWIDRFQIGGRSNRHRKIGEITRCNARGARAGRFSGDSWPLIAARGEWSRIIEREMRFGGGGIAFQKKDIEFRR